jgi:hypothetical protein
VDATALAEGSILLRTLDGLFAVAGQHWHISSTRRRLNAFLRGDEDRDERVVWLAGWMALSAVATRAAILGFSGLLGAPASGLGWLVAVPFAAAAILKPAAVLKAWRQWRSRPSFWRQRRY